MRRCQGCGQKFILHAAPEAPASGCLQAISGIVLLAGISVVAIFACCGGLAFFSGDASRQSAPPRPGNAHLKSQVIVEAPPAKKPEVTSATLPNPTPPESPVDAIASKSQQASEPANEQLYARLDEIYGTAISGVASAEVVSFLRASGFAGPEPKLHPNGLPDLPEAKVIRTWHLSKSLSDASFEVDVIGDDRGALRRLEIQVTSLDGKPAKVVAKQVIPSITNKLTRPQLTKWLTDNAGQNRTDSFDGHKVESMASSNLVVVLTVAGSPHRLATDGGSAHRPAADYHAPREWNDATGGFKVTASFVSLANGIVKLRKDDGKVIDVPMERLSAVDQEFVNRLKHN